MNLTEATAGKEYIVKQIETEDEELNSFLFSLGCYSGEPITVISHTMGGCVVAVKDGRYNMDKQLALAIHIM
jgi:ferrous iron transport protein A